MIILLPVAQADSSKTCARDDAVVRQVADLAKHKGYGKPVFRITRQADGQALLYWDYGGETRSFYAVTFRADGCAVLTKKGLPRRFVFPKSAYNTGVFEEMDLFDTAS